MTRRFFMNLRSRKRYVPDEKGEELEDGQTLLVLPFEEAAEGMRGGAGA